MRRDSGGFRMLGSQVAVLDDIARVHAMLGELRTPEAAFLQGEAALVHAGCSRAHLAVSDGDLLGSAMWKRLAVEATLRITWIAGDEWVADDSGELLVTSADIIDRCRRLDKRDSLTLGSAHRAVMTATGREVAPDIAEGLARLSAQDSIRPAPRTLADLASNQTQKALYAQFRLCSAVVHPGALVDDQKARRLVSVLIDEVAVLAVSCLRPMERALASPQ